VSVLLCVVGRQVWGVTQLDDVVYMVCHWSYSTIIRFHATSHERLTDIDVKDLRNPWDIAACQQTSQLYLTDCRLLSTDTDSGACIWRVSSDGEDIQRWWTQPWRHTFTPWTLSVTSSHVLVTSHYTDELMQLDAAGQQLRRVRLPRYMKYPEHAVESVTGTFIVCHLNTQLNDQGQCQVSEVNTAGEVLRHFSRSLGRYIPHIAVDSQGHIFVADSGRILLFDARLALRRVIIDEHQLNYEPPRRLCYNEQSAQLMVGFLIDYVSEGHYENSSVAVFDVLQR